MNFLRFNKSACKTSAKSYWLGIILFLCILCGVFIVRSTPPSVTSNNFTDSRIQSINLNKISVSANKDPKIVKPNPIIFNGNFDGSPNWQATMKPSLGSDSNFSIVNNGYTGKALEAYYKAGSYAGPKSLVGKSATSFKIRFNKSGLGIGYKDAIYFRYRVKFQENFNFRKTGKLPGLAGGTSNTGGKAPNGYDGWSNRVVWRGNSPESYLYVPGIKEFGTEIPWTDAVGNPLQFTPGRWNCIEMFVSMNTPGVNDGQIRGWLDGHEGINRSDIMYRLSSDLSIDNILFSTFFGGSDLSFASPQDQSALFDDLILSTDPIGCN